MGDKRQLLGTLLIAGGLFLFWPLTYAEFNKLSVLREGVQERDAAIAERKDIQKKIQDLKAQYDQQSSEVRNFSQIVPAQKSSAEILSALETMINQSGNAVSDVVLSTVPSTEGQHSTINISLQGKGSYFGVKSLLDSLEKSIPLVDVKSLQLTFDPQTSQLTFSLQAESYFIPSQNAAATE